MSVLDDKLSRSPHGSDGIQNDDARDLSHGSTGAGHESVKLLACGMRGGWLEQALVLPAVHPSLEEHRNRVGLCREQLARRLNSRSPATEDYLGRSRIQIMSQTSGNNSAVLRRQVRLLASADLRVNLVPRVFAANVKHACPHLRDNVKVTGDLRRL